MSARVDRRKVTFGMSCSHLWMSVAARDLSLMVRVGCGGSFIFPSSGSYDQAAL